MSPPCILGCDEDVSGGRTGRGLLEPTIAEVRSACFTLPEQWPCSGIIDPQSREILSQGKPAGVGGGRQEEHSRWVRPRVKQDLLQGVCVSDCVCVCDCV